MTEYGMHVHSSSTYDLPFLKLLSGLVLNEATEISTYLWLCSLSLGLSNFHFKDMITMHVMVIRKLLILWWFYHTYFAKLFVQTIWRVLNGIMRRIRLSRPKSFPEFVEYVISLFGLRMFVCFKVQRFNIFRRFTFSATKTSLSWILCWAPFRGHITHVMGIYYLYYVK